MRITELKDKHKGQTCYVVGRGPSLRYLTADYFGDGFVITINQSIVDVEKLGLNIPIYSMQKDGCGLMEPHKECSTEKGFDNAMPQPLNGAAVIVHSHESPFCHADYSPRYVFDSEFDFGMQWNTMSSMIAYKIAELAGANKIVFLCFDSVVSGDIRTESNGITAYHDGGEGYLNQKLFLTTLSIEKEFICPPMPKEKEKMNILIATPFYEIKGYSPYISSLFYTQKALNLAGIECSFFAVSGDAYVDSVRNRIATEFSESEFTHLLFIDSDMEWDIEGVKNLLAGDEDVVAASYPIKNDWESYTGIVNTDENRMPIASKKFLISSPAVATGFCLIKKEVFKKMIPHVQFYMGKGLSNNDRIIYDFFGRIVEDGKSYGEDYSFCKRWRDIGGAMWIAPDCNITHYGVKGWSGNFHKFLCKQPKPEGAK